MQHYMKLIKLLVMSILLFTTSGYSAVQMSNGSINTTTWKMWYTWDTSYNIASPTSTRIDAYDSYFMVITSNIGDPNNGTQINFGVRTVKGDTWESINQRFADTYGAVGSYTNTFNSNILGGTTTKYICMMLINDAGTLRSAKTGCGLLAKSAANPVTCDITGPTTIDHGFVDIANVNGNKASMTATISCTGPTSLAIQSRGSASLGNGITSQLTVDGVVYPPTRRITGPTNIQIESTLQATTPVAGNFSGSSVLIIEVL